MKLNFLNKKNKLSFVRKSFTFDSKKDWKKLLRVAMVLFILLVISSFGLVYVIKKQIFISNTSLPKATNPNETLDQQKLDSVISFFENREKNREKILTDKIGLVDPSSVDQQKEIVIPEENTTKNKDTTTATPLPVKAPTTTNQPDTKPKTLQ